MRTQYKTSSKKGDLNITDVIEVMLLCSYTPFKEESSEV